MPLRTEESEYYSGNVQCLLTGRHVLQDADGSV